MITVGLTDIGKIRQMNEDSFIVHHFENGRAFAVVADGMGGHRAGDIASTMAIDVVYERLLAKLSEVHTDVRECLYEAVESANDRIYDYSLKHSTMIGMGTTIVVAVVVEEQLYVAHVGDSRLYLIRDGQIVSVTSDHSHVQNLVNQGIITAEEARFHPKRNIILRALGTDSFVEIEVNQYPWYPGDCALLCSDGLSNMLSDTRLLEIVTQTLPAEELLQQLVTEANDAGGDDNITAVLMRHANEKGSDES
jgi:serine/threonine protein phosphatase PrpC